MRPARLADSSEHPPDAGALASTLPGEGPRPVPRAIFFAVLTLVVGATAVWRLQDLGHRGLGSDEAVYVGQGSGLAGEAGWSPVRAHPPLLGLVLHLLQRESTGEVVPRATSVVIGLVALVVAGLLARELAGPVAGVVAAVVLAVMPYHRDVTRLALVDVPMATLTALALLLVVRATRSGRVWLVEAAALTLALATLFKETAALTAAAVVLALAWRRPLLPTRTMVRAACWYLLVVLAYPLFLWWRGGLRTGLDYLGWQVGRGSSTGGSLYVDVVLPRVGLVVLVSALVGAVMLLPTRRNDVLPVVLALAVPAAFYALWPVQGYPYLLAVTVPLAALAGSGAVAVCNLLAGRRRAVAVLLTAAALVTVGGTAGSAEPPEVPGATGVQGLRETASWINDRPRAPVVSAAPWASNVVRHYLPGFEVTSFAVGGRDDSRLNPAYRDHVVLQLPRGSAFVVWDVWSAAGDPEAAAALLRLVRERGGRVAHVEVADEGPVPRILVVTYRIQS